MQTNLSNFISTVHSQVCAIPILCPLEINLTCTAILNKSLGNVYNNYSISQVHIKCQVNFARKRGKGERQIAL